jgi:hypothetical protein
MIRPVYSGVEKVVTRRVDLSMSYSIGGGSNKLSTASNYFSDYFVLSFPVYG